MQTRNSLDARSKGFEERDISEDETLRIRISETVLASLRGSQADLKVSSERAIKVAQECAKKGNKT